MAYRDFRGGVGDGVAGGGGGVDASRTRSRGKGGVTALTIT